MAGLRLGEGSRPGARSHSPELSDATGSGGGWRRRRAPVAPGRRCPLIPFPLAEEWPGSDTLAGAGRDPAHEGAGEPGRVPPAPPLRLSEPDCALSVGRPGEEQAPARRLRPHGGEADDAAAEGRMIAHEPSIPGSFESSGMGRGTPPPVDSPVRHARKRHTHRNTAGLAKPPSPFGPPGLRALRPSCASTPRAPKRAFRGRCRPPGDPGRGRSSR